jgi:hypothetical protein
LPRLCSAPRLSYTYWPHGANRRKDQVFITPGIVLGRIPLYGRLKLTVGMGYEFAVSDAHPQYENNWILSVGTCVRPSDLQPGNYHRSPLTLCSQRALSDKLVGVPVTRPLKAATDSPEDNSFLAHRSRKQPSVQILEMELRWVTILRSAF